MALETRTVHHDFWHERWRTGQTGFHQSAVHPFLERWWAGLGVPDTARVYVPLCGKSLDMAWLAERGHAVVGSELSRIAIDDFFAGRSLKPAIDTRQGFTRHAAGPYEILEGDALALTPSITGPLDAVYDRAALVALPPGTRAAYVDSLAALLPRGARGLLVSFEYAQELRDGPPFSVDTAEILQLCNGRFSVQTLQRLDILAESPKFAELGITALHEVAYALERK